MSTKLDPVAPEPAGSRPASAVGTAAVGAGRSREPVAATPESDSVKLTGEAVSLQRLERELRVGEAFDAAKVESVRAAIAAGTYTVDAQTVASRLLDLERMLDRR